MDTLHDIREKIQSNGFAVINNIFSSEDISSILKVISEADTASPTFRKTNDLFAIRQFIKEIPLTHSLIFNEKLRAIISQIFGSDYFVVKSIYFDKPEQSNWFVAYHQDLTISVQEKIDIDGFGPWAIKQNQFSVQPPINILENNFTIRIHLDDTNKDNGALRVISNSHLKGIYRAETIDWSTETEITCDVKKGGIMIMKPLLLHASSRTTNNHKRRVIHLEFSNQTLSQPLNWSEKEACM